MRHLVFERRNAERSFRAVRLRDVVATHRRRKVAARLHPAQEVVKIRLQVLLVVGSTHAVDEVVQGREHPLRMLPRLFGYPLLFRVRVRGTQGFLQRFPSVALYR